MRTIGCDAIPNFLFQISRTAGSQASCLPKRVRRIFQPFLELISVVVCKIKAFIFNSHLLQKL